MSQRVSSPAQPFDRCEQCGFDADCWNDQDSANTIRMAPQLAKVWTERLGPDLANERPEPDVWSAAEYVDHVRETFFGMRFIVDAAGANDGHDLGVGLTPAPAGPHRLIDLGVALHAVNTEARALRAALMSADDDDWERAVVIDGRRHSVRWASRHAVHDLWHHLTDIGVITAQLGAAAQPMSGTVEQVSASDGGVPKEAIDSAVIDHSGLTADRQAARAHHGRPWQAVCLWSSEVITDLNAEGHSLHPGAAGENITLAGVDWPAIHPGLYITIGEMVGQISAPAVPCAKNNRWFADNDSSRIDHDLHPGVSRWYATVIRPGTVSTGDVVSITPSPPS